MTEVNELMRELYWEKIEEDVSELLGGHPTEESILESAWFGEAQVHRFDMLKEQPKENDTAYINVDNMEFITEKGELEGNHHGVILIALPIRMMDMR